MANSAKKPVGRPRKDGLPPIQRGQVEVILANAPAPTRETAVAAPSFPVVEADTIREAVETNGLALLQDAYTRAARAATSGDPFDRAVYLTLLGKAHPMAQLDSKGKAGLKAKTRLKALDKLLAAQVEAEDAVYRPAAEGKEAG